MIASRERKRRVESVNREDNKSATRQGCCLCCYDLNIIYYDIDVIDVVVFFYFSSFFPFFPKRDSESAWTTAACYVVTCPIKVRLLGRPGNRVRPAPLIGHMALSGPSCCFRLARSGR